VVTLPVEKAVIFCGMPGSGKSIGATVAKNLGIPVFVMGDVVREEVTRRKLPHSPRTLGRIMIELREKFGPAIIAKRIVDKFSNVAGKNIVIDGARSEAEIKVFQDAVNHVLVVAVHASPQIRFQRLSQRGREDDSLTRETFRQRDTRELDVGLGRIIAQADIMIVNEGKYNELKSRVRQLLVEEFNIE
jgi:dephospho-CoA kinase